MTPRGCALKSLEAQPGPLRAPGAAAGSKPTATTRAVRSPLGEKSIARKSVPGISDGWPAPTTCSAPSPTSLKSGTVKLSRRTS